jgi:hypothetical protein
MCRWCAIGSRDARTTHSSPTTARNQADYGPAYVHRLRLIRVLTQVGGLSVASTRAVLAAIDDPGVPLYDVLGVVQRAISPADPSDESPEVATARSDVNSYLRKRRWDVPGGAPARGQLARALAALRQLGQDASADVFDRYADLADELACHEVSAMPTNADRAETVEAMVIGTVVFEAALLSLRRLAHARHSARRYPSTAECGTAKPAAAVRRVAD